MSVIDQPLNNTSAILANDEICASVSTFCSSIKSVQNIRNIANQIGCTIVIDDSGQHSNNVFLNSQLASETNVVILHNQQNSGLAYSLNQGIALASQHGYPWIITFDDDTDLKEGAVDRLVAAINNYTRA